jgi:hypothetical protein
MANYFIAGYIGIYKPATGGIAELFSAPCRKENRVGCAVSTVGHARPRARRAQPASGAGGMEGGRADRHPKHTNPH